MPVQEGACALSPGKAVTKHRTTSVTLAGSVAVLHLSTCANYGVGGEGFQEQVRVILYVLGGRKRDRESVQGGGISASK